MAALAPPYRPRRPTETVLYRVVAEHLETFIAHARETYEAPLPRYVHSHSMLLDGSKARTTR